jgi:hypothetical protein
MAGSGLGRCWSLPDISGRETGDPPDPEQPGDPGIIGTSTSLRITTSVSSLLNVDKDTDIFADGSPTGADINGDESILDYDSDSTTPAHQQ